MLTAGQTVDSTVVSIEYEVIAISSGQALPYGFFVGSLCAALWFLAKLQASMAQ